MTPAAPETPSTERPSTERSSTERAVELVRTSTSHYRATNSRGTTLDIGPGDGSDFTPVELLLVAIAGCSAVDVDAITSRRAEPEEFSLRASGQKVRDEQGNRLVDLVLDFAVRFGDDEQGRKAEAVLARSVRQSHDRLCTVSRTVEIGTPLHVTVRGEEIAEQGAPQ